MRLLCNYSTRLNCIVGRAFSVELEINRRDDGVWFVTAKMSGYEQSRYDSDLDKAVASLFEVLAHDLKEQTRAVVKDE